MSKLYKYNVHEMILKITQSIYMLDLLHVASDIASLNCMNTILKGLIKNIVWEIYNTVKWQNQGFVDVKSRASIWKAG